MQVAETELESVLQAPAAALIRMADSTMRHADDVENVSSDALVAVALIQSRGSMIRRFLARPENGYTRWPHEGVLYLLLQAVIDYSCMLGYTASKRLARLVVRTWNKQMLLLDESLQAAIADQPNLPEWIVSAEGLSHVYGTFAIRYPDTCEQYRDSVQRSGHLVAYPMAESADANDANFVEFLAELCLQEPETLAQKRARYEVIEAEEEEEEEPLAGPPEGSPPLSPVTRPEYAVSEHRFTPSQRWVHEYLDAGANIGGTPAELQKAYDEFIDSQPEEAARRGLKHFATTAAFHVAALSRLVDAGVLVPIQQTGREAPKGFRGGLFRLRYAGERPVQPRLGTKRRLPE